MIHLKSDKWNPLYVIRKFHLLNGYIVKERTINIFNML